MRVLDDLAAELADLEARGRLRSPDGARAGPPGGWIDVSSNDYLGLATQPVSRETLVTLAGSSPGAGASRLIHGTRPEHIALESQLASWVRLPAALVFSSGFAANIGCIAALASGEDLLVSDELNHASLIDGCRLSRARVRVAAHRDVDAMARALAEPARRKWVLTESYFSMDGDSPDLAALRSLCNLHGAGLIVDEAHALGVFGPAGSGLCSQSGVVPDLLIGTLGKAMGVQGAFAAASDVVRAYLWNRCRSFVFSTAVSPLLAVILRARVDSVRAADADRQRLAFLSAYFEERLKAGGVPCTPARHGPIFPILLGDNSRALLAASALRERGFLAQAIRPPTVPEGTARLRITLHSALQTTHLDDLANLLIHSCAS